MPAPSYVHIVDLDLNRHVIKRMPSITDAVIFVDRYNIQCRNVVIYAVRYEEILAFKSNTLLTTTFIPDGRIKSFIKTNNKKVLKSLGYDK